MTFDKLSIIISIQMKKFNKKAYIKKYYFDHKGKYKSRYLNHHMINISNDKSNINDNEGQFAEHLESQGKSWAYQPVKFKLKNTTYKPDFYCPENNTFYEVAGTRQAIHQRREKVKELLRIFPDINIEIVKPNGNKYKFYKEGLKMKEKTKTVILKIKESSFKGLKKIAEKEERTMASIIRQAIKEHLEKK